ncbi:hypothetical protein CM15mP43_01840 [bacterium]|nr:MAG: hypothetical protein CM15mP43_01840 [bacterium]
MNSLDKLIDITKKLRSEDGCPWDKKLTLKDLKSYILEEAYEIIDALEKMIKIISKKKREICYYR